MSKLQELKVTLIVLAFLSLTACISAKPVETQSSVDDRPLLFFVSDGAAAGSSGLTLYVDDLYMGDVSAFVNTKKGLAILPGTHLVEVRRNGTVLMKDKIYVGSGTNKTLPINIGPN